MADILITFFVFVGWSAFVTLYPLQSFFLLTGAFPLYLVRFDFGGIPLFLPEVLILAQALGLASRKLLDWKNQSFLSRTFGWIKKHFDFFKKPQIQWWKTIWPPIIFIFFGLGISLLVTPRIFILDALGIIKSWFFFPVIFFYLFLKQVSDVRGTRIALDFYVLSCLVLAGWGIFQWITGEYVTPDARVSGPFESANYLALFIAPACVYVLLRSVRRFSKGVTDRLFLFYVLSVLVLFFALYQTKSFGAFLGVIGGLFVYAVYQIFQNYNRVSAFKRLGLVVFVLMIVGSLFFVTGDRGKFDAMFQFRERSSTAVRFEVWEISRNFISKYPFSGMGIGNYQHAYEVHAEEVLGHKPFEPSILHPHNLILMFWISSGFFGLVGFVWLVVFFFRKFFREIRENQSMASVIGAMMVALLIHGMFDLPIWKNDLALQFWLIVGSIFRLRKKN